MTVLARVCWLIDGGIHCLCWMDTEERIRCRREQYRLRKDRETPEEAESRRHRNRKCLQCRRALIAVEHRRLVRNRNVQVSISTWGLICVVTHLLIWMSYLSWQASLVYHWDYFLHLNTSKEVVHASMLCHWEIIGMPVIVKTWINGSEEACRRMMTRDDDEYCTMQW